MERGFMHRAGQPALDAPRHGGARLGARSRRHRGTAGAGWECYAAKLLRARRPAGGAHPSPKRRAPGRRSGAGRRARSATRIPAHGGAGKRAHGEAVRRQRGASRHIASSWEGPAATRPRSTSPANHPPHHPPCRPSTKPCLLVWRRSGCAAAGGVGSTSRAHREDHLATLLPLLGRLGHQVGDHPRQRLGDEPPTAARQQRGRAGSVRVGAGSGRVQRHAGQTLIGAHGRDARRQAGGRRGGCWARGRQVAGAGAWSLRRAGGCGRSLCGVGHARLQAPRRPLELLQHVDRQLLGMPLLGLPLRGGLAGRAGQGCQVEK